MSTYKPNNKDFGRFMVSRQVQQPVNAVAEAVKARAVDLTPEATGAMKAAYEVNEIAPVAVNSSPRASAEVRNSNPAAPAVEFGGKRNKPVRPLGQAASEFGDVRGAG